LSYALHGWQANLRASHNLRLPDRSISNRRTAPLNG